MASWYSPFSQPFELVLRLEHLGLRRHRGTVDQLPEASLLLYHPPHQLLEQPVNLESERLDLDTLLHDIQSLVDQPSGGRVIASWRLAALGDHEIMAFLQGELPGMPSPITPADPQPLDALVALRLLDSMPGLLDAYLDLELKAELVGTKPDTNYRRRLEDACQPDAVVAALHKSATQLVEAEQKQQDSVHELHESREEAELTLLQLHQVQEELEHYFLLSRDQEQVLEQAVRLQQRSLAMLDVLNPA